ncbi:MAG: hypothetical protein V4671_05755 [Armatimonadota bacterium]
MAKSDYELFREGLERKRAPAVARAVQLLADDRYEEAEEEIRTVDSSIYGMVATAKMYRERLAELVADGVNSQNKARVEAVYHRALATAQSAYPEPHTAMEADDYTAGQAEDRAQLVAILGYDLDDK